MARDMGHWFGHHPHLVWRNTGRLWVPYRSNIGVVHEVQVNLMTDEHLELLAYGLWCVHRNCGYYGNFCNAFAEKSEQTEFIGFDSLPVISQGNLLVHPG